MMTAEQLRKPTFERTVSVDRAEVAAQRLTNSHFKTPPHARVSIPRNQDDDDIVIFDFIAQAAAQLAEKEREIARLTKTNCCGDAHMELEAAMHMVETLGFKKETQLDGHTHVWRNVRAEAAEQRLQEAQAEIDRLQDGWTKTVADKHKLIAQLGQREAELEQRWIAVGERMPPDTQPVLFGWWNTPRGSVVSHYCVEIGMHRSEDGYWEAERTAPQDEPIRFTDNSEQVTHWQPLPSPPKVQP